MRIDTLRAGLRATLVSLVASSLLVTSAGGAAAFHQYSAAKDNSEGASYTALKLLRKDKELGGYRSGTGCTTYYSGNPAPIYQTMWVATAQDNWVEMGTADQCNDFDYMFWGYGYDGEWHPWGESATPGSGDHTFTIKRDDQKRWRWKLDGVVVSGITWNVIGSKVWAGLESYDGNPVLGAHSYKNLEYKKNDGAWKRWRGRDAKLVGSAMCGKWVYDARWKAGQNTSC